MVPINRRSTPRSLGMILEPLGILDPLVSGFVGDQELETRIPELVNQVDGVLDPLALNDPGGLQDQKVIRDQARFVAGRRRYPFRQTGVDSQNRVHWE